METYSTKNKIFNSIIEPVITHLQKSNFNVHPDAFITLESTIRNIFHSIKDNESVASCASKFFDAYNEIKSLNKPTQIQWRHFVVSLCNALSKIDEYKVDCIQQALNKCQSHLDTLENSLIPTYLKPWFKEYCVNICLCISLLHKRAVELQCKTESNNIFLYIVQLTTCLKLLFNLLSEEMRHKILIIENRRFLVKRFIYCFDGIRKILTDETTEEPNPGFLQWMDNSLELISMVEPDENVLKNIENAKESIEEVLCHAMSIAQICVADDCKKIKASVQSVLHEFNQLQTECKNDPINPSMCNLFVDIVSDKLCVLETRINTAVLNISLKVFSDHLEPLKKLQSLCEESDASILKRSEDDLDDLITSFDAHVDCMIQVGLFAIACSTNTKIVAKIRSYLASLESLESELVPALTALYMEPSQVACLHATLLVKHWCDQIDKLRNDVCFIIDPVAFGQVVIDDYKSNLENLQQFMSNVESILTKDMLSPMCKRVQILILVVKASITDLKLNNDSSIIKHYKNLKDIYSEVYSAIELLSQNTDRHFSERVFKRINILSTMIGRIVEAFSQENKDSTTVQNKSNQHVSCKDKTVIIKNKSVDNKTYDISLKTLQNRGEQILKDRSILYKTPRKTNKLLTATPKTVSSLKFSENRKMGASFVRKIVLPNCETSDASETMDLQITEILDELTSLADTLM